MPTLNPIIEVNDILIGQADAARRHEAADGRRLVGAVDPVDGLAEIESARAQRIAFAAAMKRGR